MKIKSVFTLKNIISFISKERVLEIFKYNNRIKKSLKINLYDYQKLFIQNHFIANLSKYKSSNVIKFLNSYYNNFTEKNSEKNLIKIISEIPWLNEFQKEKLVQKNTKTYKKINSFEQAKTIKNMDLNSLNNLRILNIKLPDQYDKNLKEIVIKDIFPNLVKLKILDEYTKKYIETQSLINISVNLLKKLEILSLINLKVKFIDIEKKTKIIEFPALKSLKINYNNFENNEEIICPNLQYIYCENEENSNNSLIVDNIFFGGIEFEKENLYKIPLKFPKLIYFNYLYYMTMSNSDNSFYNEMTIRKFKNSLIKYEIKNAGEDYYSKEVFYSKDNKIDCGKLENYEDIYLTLGDDEIPVEINLFKKIKNNNFSLKYIDIVIKTGKKLTKTMLNNFIDNIKKFIMLKTFSLTIEEKSIFAKKELLNLVNNLANLKLIEI